MFISNKAKLLILLTTFEIFSIYSILCKPLTPAVLEYLEKDEEVYLNYRSQYKYLNCKLLTYSRIKYFYEKELIDQFMNQTKNKEGFLDYYQKKVLDYCLKVYTANNMEIFEPEQYVAWNTQNDAWVAVNLTDAFANFTLAEQGQKDDL